MKAIVRYPSHPEWAWEFHPNRPRFVARSLTERKRATDSRQAKEMGTHFHLAKEKERGFALAMGKVRDFDSEREKVKDFDSAMEKERGRFAAAPFDCCHSFPVDLFVVVVAAAVGPACPAGLYPVGPCSVYSAASASSDE